MAWPQTDKPMHIVCPNCAATNRIQPGQDPMAAKCGVCQTRLFGGTPWAATSKTFDKQISRDDVPVVVDFWAEWCGPCKAMAPYYERAASELEPAFRFLKLDTEAEPEIAGRYNIRAIPTVMVFRKGKVIGQRSGALDNRTLVEWLNALPAEAPAS